MKLLLRFNTDGSVVGLYDDSILDLGLGRMETERATEVEFDETTQEWVARAIRANRTAGISAGQEIARSPLRADALAKEREVLQSWIGATWDEEKARWIPFRSDPSLIEGNAVGDSR